MEPNAVKTREKPILVMAVMYFVFQLTSIIFSAIDHIAPISWIGTCIVQIIVCFLLYFSYRSHTKNVMKPLIGASLTLMLCYDMEGVASFFSDMGSYGDSKVLWVFGIVCVLLFAVISTIAILHYAINATHQSSPKKVEANKVLAVIYFLLIVAECAVACFLFNSLNAKLSYVIGELADTFTLAEIIIIERSLDKFRIARESK